MVSVQQSVVLICAAALAGAINSVAGGGTLLTFPALMWTGQLSTVANATSTVALWPGVVSSLWGYRKEIKQNASSVIPLLVIGLIGGVVGAELLLHTPAGIFDHIVPFLILAATSIFMAQEPLARRQRARAAAKAASAGSDTPKAADIPDAPENNMLRLTPGVAIFLLIVALYGGYFGAGIGILTLAAFGVIGMTNIHQMNGLKNAFSMTINAVAALLFVGRGLVDWRIAGLMAAGSVFGGYAGAGIARKIGQNNVRRLVIAIGLILTSSLIWKQFLHPFFH